MKSSTLRSAVHSISVLALFAAVSAEAADLSYAGRLVDAAGVPLAGPVDITLRFYGSATGSDQLGPTKTLAGVTLEGGVFQLTVSLDAADEAAIFQDGAAAVFVEVEAAGKLYPRQRFTAVPLALRIPVDNGSLVYGQDARLKVGEIAIGQVQGLSAALAQKVDSTPASASSSGYLSPSDWTAFNAKQDAITASSSLTMGSLSTAERDAVVIRPYGAQAGETGELRFEGGASGNYVAFKAPNTLTANEVWTLPAADGAAGQFLKTDGSGVLSWDSPSGAGDMLRSANLSDVASVSAARTNLGLGALATLSSVGSSEISDGAIANADISGTAAIATSKLSGAVTSIAGHGLGSLATLSAVGTADITDGSVASADIADGTIVDADVSASAAIATSKLSGAVTSISGHGLGSLATLSTIGSGEITDGAIADADVSGTAAIATSKLSGPVTQVAGHGLGSLASLSAVGASEITDGSIADADISATAAISSSKISFVNDGISGDKIDGGTISNFASTGIDDNAASPAITINSSGNVGFGTTNPRSKVELALNDSSSVLGANLTQVGLLLRNQDTTTNNWNLVEFDSANGGVAASIGTQIKDHTNHYGDFAIATRGTGGWGERMRVTSSGDVGIGTTSPGYALDVVGTGIRLMNPNFSQTALYIENTSGTAGVNNWSMRSGTVGLAVRDTTNGLDRFTIKNDGNVGIGTTAPAGLLDVNGKLTVLSGGNIGLGTTAPNSRLDVFKKGDTSPNVFTGSSILVGDNTNYGVGLQSDTATNGIIGFRGTGWAHGYLVYYPHKTDGGSYFRMTGQSSTYGDMTVGLLVDGNVGIGSTSPAAALDVNGSLATKSSYEGLSTAVNSGTAYTIPDTSVNVRQITLTGNATITLPAFTSPTNAVYTLTIFLTQDATGSRTVTWAANGSDTVLWDGGTAPTISATANYLTILQFTKLSSESTWYGSMVWRRN